MKDLRILFMGTPDFATASLATMLARDYNVVGVVTAVDRPAGRGRKVKASAVKEFAFSKNLPILQPSNLKDETFLEELKGLNANLFIVVAFRMLPRAVWSMPKYGTFNLHASLLPDYRGAAPINWVLINGENTTGVTTFFIDDHIDTGQMILQEEIKIDPDETAGTLHDKLMIKGADLVLKTVELIANSEKVPTKPQPERSGLKTAYKLHKENTKINWEASPINIDNLVRGLSPYPSAWSYLHNNGEKLSVKIYSTKFQAGQHLLETGKIVVEGSEIKVAVSGGFIYILTLQLPGKKRMDSKSLLNGYTFFSDARMS